VFSESIGTLFKAIVQHLIGTEIEEGARHTFLGEKSCTVRMDLRRNRGPYHRKFWAHFSRHFFLLGFSYSLGRILGTNFETVRRALIVGTVV
jgi:hypothetical protein